MYKYATRCVQQATFEVIYSPRSVQYCCRMFWNWPLKFTYKKVCSQVLLLGNNCHVTFLCQSDYFYFVNFSIKIFLRDIFLRSWIKFLHRICRITLGICITRRLTSLHKGKVKWHVQLMVLNCFHLADRTKAITVSRRPTYLLMYQMKKSQRSIVLVKELKRPTQ